MRDPLETVRELLRLNAETKKEQDALSETEPPRYELRRVMLSIERHKAAGKLAQSERALGCGGLKDALPALCREIEVWREHHEASRLYESLGGDAARRKKMSDEKVAAHHAAHERRRIAVAALHALPFVKESR